MPQFSFSVPFTRAWYLAGLGLPALVINSLQIQAARHDGHPWELEKWMLTQVPKEGVSLPIGKVGTYRIQAQYRICLSQIGWQGVLWRLRNSENPLGGKINDTETASFRYVILHSSKAWIPVIRNLRKSLRIQSLKLILLKLTKESEWIFTIQNKNIFHFIKLVLKHLFHHTIVYSN